MENKIWSRLMWLAAIVIVTSPVTSADIILSLQPPSQSVTQGPQLTVDLDIVGVAHPPSLATFDVKVAFDPTILSFDTFVFGDPVRGDQLDPTGRGNTITVITPGVGTTELFELSLDSSSTLNSLQASGFTLGRLTFSTIALGTSPLNLTINSLGDADGNALTAILQNGSAAITSSTVPEPTAIYLLGGALVTLAIMRRRFTH